MRILLAKRRALGDTVLLAGSVAALRAALPEAEISVLVPRAFAPLLDGHPDIKQILCFEESWISLVPRLRRERFDHYFQLHASPGNRWLAWLAGAQNLHYHAQNDETEKAYGRHPNALEWDSFYFRSVFGPSVPLPAPPPRIILREEERAAGRAYWRGLGADEKRLVFLGLGASRPYKRWPPAHFARLAELLRDRADARPVFVAGPGAEEEAFAGRVIDEMRVRGLRPVGAAGRGDFLHGAGLGVRQLAGALAACTAYVGNDSGPKHVAVALGLPTLTLFGPEDPAEWHPYDRQAHPVFYRPGQGAWRGDESFAAEGHRRMAEIDPLEVFAELAGRIR